MQSGQHGVPGELKGCEAIREFRRRKQAEQDAAVLRNRLLQLERQADRAKKRIAQTRQRAKEVVAQRERNAQREKEKLKLVKDLEFSIESHRQAINRTKEVSKRKRLENEARMFQQKLALVQETRCESQEIDRIIAEQRLYQRRVALEKKDEVKQSVEQASYAKHKDEERKHGMARETYDEKHRREAAARKEMELELQRMAQLEVKLIEQLKERQREQDEVSLGIMAIIDMGYRYGIDSVRFLVTQAYEQLRAVVGMGRASAPAVRRPRCTNRVQQSQDKYMGGLKQRSVDSPQHRAHSAFTTTARAHGVTAGNVIPSAELGSVLEAMGVFLEEYQMAEALLQLDGNQSGEITLQDFLVWASG